MEVVGLNKPISDTNLYRSINKINMIKKLTAKGAKINRNGCNK